MPNVLDLNKNEVKVLLSGLHNLSLDKEVLDYLDNINYGMKDAVESLIFKFEEVIKNS